MTLRALCRRTVSGRAGARLAGVACLLLALVLILARATQSSAPAAKVPPTFDPITLESSSAAGTRFVVRVPEPRFVPLGDPAAAGSKAESAAADAGVEVEVDGFLPASQPGAPALPARTVLVAIPAGAHPTLRFLLGEEREFPIPGRRVAPVPIPAAKPARGEPVALVRVLDPKAYAALYPPVPVVMGAVQQLRDLEVVPVTIWPTQVDPVRNTLRMAGEITIEIATSGGRATDARAAAAPGGTPSAEQLLAPVLNAVQIASFRQQHPEPALQRATGGQVGFDSSTHWVRLKVAARGLTRVTGTSLSTAGVAIGSIDPATLRIFWGGGLDPEPGVSPRHPSQPSFMGECAIEVVGGGDGEFEPQDAIIFLGQGCSGWRDDFTAQPYALDYHLNGTNRQGVYWLTWGGVFPGSPLRITSRDAAPQVGAQVVDTGRARYHYERDLRYLPDLFERNVLWERWFDAVVDDRDPPVYFPFNALKPVTSSPGSVKLRLWGYSFAGQGGVYDHYARVWFNNQPILNPNPAFGDTIAWSGPDFALSGRQDVESNAVPIVDGQNRVQFDVLVVPNPGGGLRPDEVAIAWYDAGYTRRLDFAGETGGEVVPLGTPGPATVEVLNAPPSARVFDASDPYRPVELTGVERVGSTVRFHAEVSDASPPKFLVGVTPTSPAAIEVDQSQPNLRSATQSAWYVVIAHDSMVQEGVRLAAAHAQAGPPEGPLPGTPLVVRVSDVFDEFGWGVRSDIAIRNFIDYATYTWAGPPRYVCLLGDASFDPLDIFGGGQRATDLIPAPRSWNFIGGQFGGSEFLSDDYYVRTFGARLDSMPDQITDLMIGRLPASNVDEARVMVDEKTIPLVSRIECGPWRQRVLLAADDEYAGNPPVFETFVHTDQTEILARLLPKELERVKVYLLDYPRDATGSKPEARAAFIRAFNDGAAFVNYMGHGSPDVLAHEAMFRVENVGQLVNETRLPIFSTYSCTVNRFDEVDQEGIGEALVAHRGGGALAAIGSTDLAFVSTNVSLNRETYFAFYDNSDLEAPRPVGAALGGAKNLLSSGDSAGVRKYVLLGDPALIPPTPTRRLALLVPGASSQADTLHLVAGVPYQLRGYFPGGGVPTYNGDVLVRDSQILQTRRGPSGNGGTFYLLPGNPVFRSRIAVNGDTLRTPIVVPIDASQSQSVGRGAGEVRVYVDACSQGLDGLGWAPLFLDVQGAQPVEPDSDGGPDIEVAFNPSAGAVPPNSQLTIRMEDKSGINIVGNTPSNYVFMRLDEVTTVVLNDRFAYDPGSATAGQVDFPVAGLGEGPHVLRVTASDNYLNRSEVEVPFTVVVPGGMAIRSPGLYPNPFAPAEGQATVIAFDLPEPADVQIRLYTVNGRLIREEFTGLSGPVGAGPSQIYWDGRDEEGDLVANGVYLCSISARGLASGERAEVVLRSVVRR
ncbi:MAG TPA: C25 family cysteine peptidase [Candidatus Udaeobacter sp.]|nr:C25 family cysteine peptidase [Candidatus Udaeobacter sp.]